jgi:uncharacterized integral membrane protein
MGAAETESEDMMWTTFDTVFLAWCWAFPLIAIAVGFALGARRCRLWKQQKKARKG